jgi:hypothetical protein
MKLFILFFLTGIVFSCKTIKVTDYYNDQKMANRIPLLESKTDKYSLENVYSTGTMETKYKSANAGINQQIGNSGTSASGGVTIGKAKTTSYHDKRIQDIITTFQNEVNDNITVGLGEKKGIITCKIIDGKIKNKAWGYTILSYPTLGIANLFGMKYKNYETTLNIEIEIEVKNNIVGRYKIEGIGTAKVALYSGYNEIDAIRKSNIDAFKDGMNKLKKRIEEDKSLNFN